MISRLIMLFVALTLLVLVAPTTPALAGAGTVLYTTSGTATFATTTDSNAYNYSRQTIWDYSAAANGLSVDAQHGALIAGEGTAGAGAGGILTVQGASGGTALPTLDNNSAAILAGVTGAIPAGTNLIGSVLTSPTTPSLWGIGPTTLAVPTSAVYSAGLASSSEPAKATTGNLTGRFADLAGKTVTSPYANRENFARGYAALNGTTSTTIIAANATLKTYVTDLTCTRSDTSTTALTVTLNDTTSTVIDLPNNGGGGGYSHAYNVPLATNSVNQTFTIAAGALGATTHCHATGYYGY